MSTQTSGQQNSLEQRKEPLPRHSSWFNLQIRHRVPLFIGILLFAILGVSAIASYRAVRESSFEIGRERLRALTQQFANLSQQSSANRLNQTVVAATNPAISAVLRSPSPDTRTQAVALLQQFAPGQDPNNLQVELWDASHSLALTVPANSSPLAANLDLEFKQCATEPFKTMGALRVVNDTIIVPAVAAARDDSGSPLGYLVTWRKVSISPGPRQLTELLGDRATLYFGNAQGNVWTDLTRIHTQPPINVNSPSQITHYVRDGHGYMGLGRLISGTPWAIVIEISDEAFVAQTNNYLRRMSFVGLGLLAIGIAGAFALSRNITRPLDSLTEAASAISNGDYSHTVDVRRNDELGALANAFNSMVLRTRDSQQELEQKIQERTLQLEAAPSAMLMVDERGCVTLVNSQAEMLFGYARAELLGQPVEMLVPERYRGAHPGHRKIFSDHPTARGMGAGRDLYGLRKDGSEVPIEIGLNPLQTDRGAFVLASIIDITERKRAEERFRIVVEAAPSAMMMVNSDGAITLVNKQTEKLFGYERQELLGQPVEVLVPERYRSSHPNARKIFSGQPSARAMGAGRDLYGLCKDGSEVPIEIGLNPIETSEGAFVLTSIIDITHRKRAEERFRRLIEHAPNGMVMVDQQGKISLVNAQIEKWFGYSRDELIGHPIETLVPQRFHSHHAAYRDEFIKNPSPRPMGAGRDLYGLRKDGYEFPVEIGLTPIDTEQGTMVLGTIVDITERKLAEQKMRRSQEQLAGVIGSAMDAIITVDEEQRIVLFNAAAETMFLFPAEDAMGQPIDRFIPERFRGAHRGHIENFGQTNVTKRSMGTLGALYGLRANGQEFPIEASISQIDSEGQKLFTVILRDITQRRQAEAALKEQGQVLDLAPVFIRDPVNEKLLFWNTGAEQMYGWNEEEALGKAAYNLLRTVFPEPREKLQAILFARGHWEGELLHTRRDGEQIVVASHWVLHRDDHGRPKAILEVNNDITNWRRAEEKLTRLATAVEQSGDSIVITDTDGNIQYVNPAFEQTTGYSSEEVIGKNPRFLKGGKAKVEYYQDLWNTITSGAQWTGHFTNRKKDGTLFEEEASISAVRDAAGKIVSYVAVKRDVTERMRAQEEIRQLNEELEQRVADRTAQLQAANKELEAFSYSVSHDLRAPLRHINGFSQALLEDYADQLDAGGKSYLHEVRNASQEMAQLIDDVLQLARVTRSEMHREEVSLSDLARTVIADLQKRSGRRAVDINIEEDLCTRGDKRLLRIVLVNLLGNAWKFTSKEAETKITFGSQPSNGEVVYFVRDNGAGFDMSYVGKLFGAFQRLHTASEFEGTGIGLATVQRIVTRHGGRVWAEGKPSEGATFYFALPTIKERGDE